MSLDDHMLTHFDHDEYYEIKNGPKTYESIVKGLIRVGSVIIGWTDEAGTHLDIMFTYDPIQAGSLQRGMNASTDVFVAISGFGFHGFEIDTVDLNSGYIGEKFRLGDNITTEKIAELVNEVKARLCNS